MRQLQNRMHARRLAALHTIGMEPPPKRIRIEQNIHTGKLYIYTEILSKPLPLVIKSIIIQLYVLSCRTWKRETKERKINYVYRKAAVRQPGAGTTHH